MMNLSKIYPNRAQMLQLISTRASRTCSNEGEAPTCIPDVLVPPHRQSLID